MKIKTPLHAEHALDQLAGQFEHWRQTRSHPRERIPIMLWNQAVALTSTLSPSRVAKHLRLGGADFKRHLARRHEQAMLLTPAGFVEVPPAQPQLLGRLEVELHRPDGARLSIHSADASLPLATLVQSFLEARSCSN